MDSKPVKFLCVAVVASTLVQQMNACVTVNLHNESDHKLHVDWMAPGCAGVDLNPLLTLICSEHDVDGGTTQGYDFKMFTTQQSVAVTFKGFRNAEGLHVMLPYTYHHGHGYKKSKSLFGGTPGSCDRHCNIHITNDVLQAALDQAVSRGNN